MKAIELLEKLQEIQSGDPAFFMRKLNIEVSANGEDFNLDVTTLDITLEHKSNTILLIITD